MIFTVYGQRTPKLDFAFTGEPPFFVLSFVNRTRYYMDKQNTLVFEDFGQFIRNDTYEITIDKLNECIEYICNSHQSGTIIIDRMTDLIKTMLYRGDNFNFEDIVSILSSTKLDLVMLFGEKETWDCRTGKPTGIKIPDADRVFYYLCDFVIHAPATGELTIEKMIPEYREMRDITISTLKQQDGRL
jgi:hypothetical protein